MLKKTPSKHHSKASLLNDFNQTRKNSDKKSFSVERKKKLSKKKSIILNCEEASTKVKGKKNTETENDLLSRKLEMTSQPVARRLFSSDHGGEGKEQYPEKYLKNEVNLCIRINRGRIFDWFLDILSAFEMRWQTYWYAIQLFDHLVKEYDYVRPRNVHIVGTTCLFMASKIHELSAPRLKQDLIQKAVHHAFTEKSVHEEQSKIINLCFNHSQNLKFFSTIYTESFKMYPSLPLEKRIQSMKILICVWIDPVKSLSIECSQISYRKLIIEVTQCVLRNKVFRNYEEVMKEFSHQHGCLNLSDHKKILKYLKI